MKFGLENMRQICAALGHPEKSFHSVIVAGTNGKGSVTAMTSAALHAAGIRSARYTSPHLERIEERFVIGEREVLSSDLEAAAATVQHVVEDLVRAGTLESLPTFFECATAIAFELFRAARVEVAVVEVGLGGRLDATNVITPRAAAITSIAFDHQDLLGETLESIASEKAGVIKPGIPVIVGPVAPGPRTVIEDVCRAQRATFISAPSTVEVDVRSVNGSERISLRTGRYAIDDVALGLEGRHQIENAAVAFALMCELAGMGFRLDERAMSTGLSSARWPGRLERIEWNGADVILDAAHNPAGAMTLAAHLHKIGWNGITAVVGVMRDKDVTGMLDALLPCCVSLICTTPPSPRALPAADLAAIAKGRAQHPVEILTIDSPEMAMRHACQPGARVVGAGSIFLIGPLRGILR